MKYTDLWPLIQQDILGALLGDDVIGQRKGLLVEPGDIEGVLNSKVDAALGLGLDGRLGLGFLVLPIEKASDDNVNLPGGPLKLTITVQFVENVTLNRGPRGTQMPCRVFVARAEKILKLYTPVGLTQSLVPASPVIHEFTPDRDDNLRVGQLEFTAMEADFTPYIRLNRPQIVVTGSAYPYTVAVNAPDAATIFYTTDNTHPYQGNATAIPYTAPFPITAPCLLRVRSFNPPKIASDTAAQNFT